MAESPEASKLQFQYAVVRVVPRVERGESLNAGVIVLSRPRKFLGARVSLDEARLRAIDPNADPATILPHLAAIEKIAAGDPSAGPIARLSLAERFHWLTSPSSTVIQPSDVHGGMTDAPERSLEDLFERLVR